MKGVPYEDKERLKGVVKHIEWNYPAKAWMVPAALWNYNDILFVYPNIILEPSAKAWAEATANQRAAILHTKEQADIPQLKEKWAWAFPHQRVDSYVHLKLGRSADWSDPGTGKTLKFIIVGIESGALENGGHAIVISPNSAKLNWRNEIRAAQEQYGVKYPIFVHYGNASKERQLAHLRQWVDYGGWLILNWESLAKLIEVNKDRRQKFNTKGILIDLLNEQGHEGFDYLATDESHRGKDKDAQQTRALDILSQLTPRVFEGTGTPLTTKPDNLWAGFHRLYPDKFPSYWDFVDRYCNVEVEDIWTKDKQGNPVKRTIKRILDGFNQKHIEEFNMIAANITIRRRFEEVVDIPEKQHKYLPIELNRQQEQLYKTALHDWFKVLRKDGDEELVPIPNVISQITYLRQILLDPNIVGFETGYTPAKTAMLLERLHDLDDKPLVVMTKFVKYVDRLEAVMRREGISYMRITGRERPEQRQSNVEAFQDNRVRVALCGIDAAGVALTLTAASHMDFTDRDWTKTANDQAEGRIRRIGQRHPQFFTIYTVEGSVEQRIEASVEVKAAFEEAFVNKTGSMKVKDLKRLLMGGE